MCSVIIDIDSDNYQFCLAQCETKYCTSTQNSEILCMKVARQTEDKLTLISKHIYSIFLQCFWFRSRNKYVQLVLAWSGNIHSGLISIMEKQRAREKWNDTDREKLNYMEKNMSYFIHLPSALYIILANYSAVTWNSSLHHLTMKLKTGSALKSCLRSPPACLHKPSVNTVITMCCRCWQHMKLYPHVQRWVSHNCGIFSKMLPVVTDWQMLLVSVVGGSLVSASVYGLLLYGAYKVSTVCGYCGMRFLPGYLWIF